MMNEEEQWKILLKGSEQKTTVMDGANQKILNCEHYCGRPVLGKVIALPISALHNFKYDKPWAAISITNPDDVLPKISEDNRIDLLSLQFDDVEFIRGTMVPISSEQAKQVWEFVEQYWNNIDLLMVHCHAGFSRSTAISKAISEKYQPNFADYFEQLYMPNKLVLKIWKEADND